MNSSNSLDSNLFSDFDSNRELSSAPLADRLRPNSLDEFIGQEELLAEGKLFRKAIEEDHVKNIILYGPPGIGKTTLGLIIAENTRSNFISVNAVLSGVRELKDIIHIANEKFKNTSRKTILFVDEVHRFNKIQQDALLPFVENGILTFVGATTENPFYEITNALLSRSKVYKLKPLSNSNLRKVLFRALNDSSKGLGDKDIRINEDAINLLVDSSNGDARQLLNSLELAIDSYDYQKDNVFKINLKLIQESIQSRISSLSNLQSRYKFLSALIKSIRGSDPDAALFWLAKLLESGEDEKTIFRRLLVLAAEDVGLADPNAITIVNSCANSFEKVGLPEGIYFLSEATLYLSIVDKSNSTAGIFKAIDSLGNAKHSKVPDHLHNFQGNENSEIYKNPHKSNNHWVSQQYLPDYLTQEEFFKPGNLGWEKYHKDRVMSRRRIQQNFNRTQKD
tara:strand:- start:11665 stop:13017 length:1353 start_codon:yes stop_codon:yes gene_type:complete